MQRNHVGQARCKNISMEEYYFTIPNIHITPVNKVQATSFATSSYSDHDAVVWVEKISSTQFELCYKSLRAALYESTIMVSYIVLSKDPQPVS